MLQMDRNLCPRHENGWAFAVFNIKVVIFLCLVVCRFPNVELISHSRQQSEEAREEGILVATHTCVKYCAPLVRTPKLYRGEVHFLPTTLGARMLSEGFRLLILCRQRLNGRFLRPQCRGKGTRFGLAHDCCRRGVWRETEKDHNPKLDTPISSALCPSLFSPLFRAPQTSHSNVAFALPVDSSRRFPQSVQNINEPTADML